MNAPDISFRPFVEFGAVWDSGLADVAVTDTGQLANASSYGLTLAWGVSGSHSWKRTKVGLDYRGDMQHYFRQTSFDYVDQSMLLSVTHQFSRHVVLDLRESAGMFSRNFGLLSLPQTVPYDPSTAYIPTTDFFDNRTIYATSQASLTIQKTARLSFDLGGMGFTTIRQSHDLYGANGAGAQGDVQYRLTRYTTIGASYGYQAYRFPHIGGSDVQEWNFAFSKAFSRRTEFSGYAGVARAESKFVQSVPVSPVIATLLGITSTTQIYHGIYWGPSLAGRISRSFRKGVAYIGAGHTIIPGNGLFLTSAALDVFGGYSYTGLRRWSFTAQAGYDRATSFGNISGVYGSESSIVSASRQLMRYVHFVASFSARHYNSPDFNKYHRLIYDASVGIGFAPGDVPLRIW